MGLIALKLHFSNFDLSVGNYESPAAGLQNRLINIDRHRECELSKTMSQCSSLRSRITVACHVAKN